MSDEPKLKNGWYTNPNNPDEQLEYKDGYPTGRGTINLVLRGQPRIGPPEYEGQKPLIVDSKNHSSLWTKGEIRQLIREEIAKAQPIIHVITPHNYSVKQETVNEQRETAPWLFNAVNDNKPTVKTMMLTEDGHETVEEYMNARRPFINQDQEMRAYASYHAEKDWREGKQGTH